MATKHIESAQQEWDNVVLLVLLFQLGHETCYHYPKQLSLLAMVDAVNVNFIGHSFLLKSQRGLSRSSSQLTPPVRLRGGH